MRTKGAVLSKLAMAAAIVPTACTLSDVQIAEADDVLLVEAYVTWAAPAPRAAARVFLHGTLTTEDELRPSTLDAFIEMIAEDGQRTALLEVPPEVCLASDTPADRNPGRCYAGALAASVTPGRRVLMEIEMADGRIVTGGTVLPNDFDIVSPITSSRTCRVPARRLLEVAWTSSAGAWAYTTETSLRGARDVLGALDGQFQELDDPLLLFGLAISDADTAVSFPNEYGLFDRFGDDVTTLALIELQEGLLNGMSASITVAAADRNYVNWQRGGNFNPSGLVRVPSLRGDGTGVLGSTVARAVNLEVGDPVPGRPACEGIVPQAAAQTAP